MYLENLESYLLEIFLKSKKLDWVAQTSIKT
jgi:hypothetical protein